MPRKDSNKRELQRGFTMIELMVSMTILTLVAAVVVSGLTSLVQRNRMETTKVDLTQEARQFMDQIVGDIHQSGFPSAKMFDMSSLVPPTTPANFNCNLYVQVSCGLVNLTASSVQFEGDVDGSGTVSEVFIQLNPLNGPCPCIIQRGTVSKAVWIANQTPPIYYTEVNNVNNVNIFQAYDNGGNNVALPGACPYPCNNISAIEITLNVLSPIQDSNGSTPTITMSTGAKIHNYN
jgi:prepilin-type N-terminal cleavage/methylation domain-containing protein